MSFMFLEAIALVHRRELRGLVFLRVEHLHETVSVDGLLGHPRDIAHGALNARAVATEGTVDDTDERGDDRRDEQGKSRQAPVQPEDVAQQADDGERVADEHGNGIGGGFSTSSVLKVSRDSSEPPVSRS